MDEQTILMQQDKINDTNFMKVYFGITILCPILLTWVAVYCAMSRNKVGYKLDITESVTYSFFKDLFKLKKQVLIDISEKSKDEFQKKEITDVLKTLNDFSFSNKDPETAAEMIKFKKEIVDISARIKSLTKNSTGSDISETTARRKGFDSFYMELLINTLDAYLKEIKIKK